MMAIPTPDTANLEVRMTRRGRLEAFWKGDRLPSVQIDIAHTRGEAAEITLRFVGPQVKLSTEPDGE